MTMRCPFCEASGTLNISHRLELPPDHRSDEVTLQIVACAGCGVEAGAIYEESRRGASETYNHFAFEVDDLSLRRLKGQITSCPEPRNKRCTCQAHLDLAGKAAYGLVTKCLNIEWSR